MKKIVYIFLIIILSFLFVGCHDKPNNIDDSIYTYSSKVIDILDKYIDAEISAKDANEQVSNLYLKIESSVSTNDEVNVQHYVRMIKMTLERDEWYNQKKEPTASYTDLIEMRNNLALKLNIKERK